MSQGILSPRNITLRPKSHKLQNGLIPEGDPTPLVFLLTFHRVDVTYVCQLDQCCITGIFSCLPKCLFINAKGVAEPGPYSVKPLCVELIESGLLNFSNSDD